MTVKKYADRTSPIINRQSYNVESAPKLPNWMNDFAKNLEKTSVQSREKDQSLYDQISSIISGNRSKYPSVEAAVQDMQERTGLSALHNQIMAAKEDKNKKAENKVKLFEMFPPIKQTIDNYCSDTKGNFTIPAIKDKIKSIHKNDIFDDSAWDDPALYQYINNKNIEEKKRNPEMDAQYTNLGKMNYRNDDEDPSNDDAFHALTPSVVK